MIQKVFLLALIQILCISAGAQKIDLAQFLDAGMYDGITPFDYQKIKFNWNMPGPVQVEMNEGLNAMDEDQHAVAIAHFDEVLKLDPNFGPAYYYRAVCNKHQLNLYAAEYDITKAEQLLKTPECLIELGDIHYLKRNFFLAGKTYNKVIDTNPNLATARYKLGCFSVNLNNIAEAEKNFEKCSALNPGFLKAYLQLGFINLRFKRNFAGANQFFTKAIEADSSKAEPYFWRGLSSLIEGKGSRSLPDLNKTVELAPTNPYFRLIRGLILIDRKEFDDAYTDLRRALIGTRVGEEKSQFGQTFLDKKIDLQNGCVYLDRVLYGYDDLSAEFLKKGFCYLLAGHYPGAIENFNKVSRLNKSACETYLTALAYEHMGQHNLAYDTYSSALLLDPDIFDAHKKRAIYRSELKDWNGAYADLKEMRRLQPGSNVIHRLDGFLKYNSGDYRGSIDEMDHYLTEDSTDVEAIKVRADSKAKLKDFRGAVSDFKRVILLSRDKEKLDLDNLVITYTLQAGDTANAINLLIDFNETYRLLESKVWLTELYIETKNFKKAEDIISQLEKLFRTSPGLQNKMSFVYYLRSELKSKRELYADALTQINKSLKISNSDDFLFQRAKVFFQMNRIEDGRNDLSTLKKKGFKPAEAFYSKYDIP